MSLPTKMHFYVIISLTIYIDFKFYKCLLNKGVYYLKGFYEGLSKLQALHS